MKQLTNEEYKYFLNVEVDELKLIPKQSLMKVEWIDKDGKVIVKNQCFGGRYEGYTFIVTDMREQNRINND